MINKNKFIDFLISELSNVTFSDDDGYEVIGWDYVVDFLEKQRDLKDE